MIGPITSGPLANYLAHAGEIDQAVRRVLGSGRYILGQETAAFEREFAGYLGAGHAVGAGNGTDALHLALKACGIEVGDGVITVSHTAVATVAAIELAGALPILADIDPATYTMSPLSLERVLETAAGRRARVVIPVHLYGHPADMDGIGEIAGRRGLMVIEDCAQAHGATLHGRRLGCFGRAAAFSFYPTKNLGAMGDGGAMVTADLAVAERARSLREYGWRERYVSATGGGFNTRLDELQAAILRVKLPYLDEENERRRALAAVYRQGLAGKGIALPETRPDATHVYHQYVVRTGRRDSLRAFLRENGVETGIHYPVPVHLQPAYVGRLASDPAGLPQTEQAAREVLSLPMHPHLTDGTVRQVYALVSDWAEREVAVAAG